MQIKRIIRVPLIQLRIPFLPDVRVADDSVAEVGFAELHPRYINRYPRAAMLEGWVEGNLHMQTFPKETHSAHPPPCASSHPHRTTSPQGPSQQYVSPTRADSTTSSPSVSP